MVQDYVNTVFKNMDVAHVAAKSFAHMERDGLIVKNVMEKAYVFMKNSGVFV
jgi:hypothetical protein